MSQVVRWTQADDIMAWSYGWGIFDVDSAGNGFLEIQRCDDPPAFLQGEVFMTDEDAFEPIFDSDGEARAHVRAMAAKFPGEWHSRALAYIEQQNQGKTRPIV